MQVNELLKLMIDKKASDLHLRVPSPPMLRINGKLVPQRNLPSVTPKDVEMLFESVTTQEQRDAFQRDLGVDFSYSISGLARFRISALKQRGSISLAFRAVPFQALSIDKLGIPQICKQFVLKPRGLILVTGPNGSGKSTTLAAMVDYLNENADKNIVTIEDPIEYLYQNKKSIIAQRDVGNDAKSFEDALIQALRHDPDVIVIGEMRSLSTIATSIRAAETGHLILGTLHATDATQAAERIIDPFPAEQQQQIRLQLSQVIEAVLWQTLVPFADGTGRAAVFEILTATAAVRSLIRDGKTSELKTVMQMSSGDGMQTLDQALAKLVRARKITLQDAEARSSNPKQLNKLFQYEYSGDKNYAGPSPADIQPRRMANTIA